MANQCEQVEVDTHNPLFEGICPAGYQPVSCGQAGQPACDASACGDISQPPPGPSCTEGELVRSESSCVGVQMCTRNINHRADCSEYAGDWYNCADSAECGYDPQEPVCSYFKLNGKTSETVNQGDSVTISTLVSDNVKVSQIVLAVADTGAQIGPTFTNDSSANPYGVIHGYSTSSLAPDTYTLVANASDAASNDMIGPTCSFGVFSGCTLQGGDTCNDWGTPESSVCADA